MSEKTQLGPIGVFDAGSLADALRAYQREALTAYPHQQERIDTTIAAMRDFLYSSHARRLMTRAGRDQ